MAGAPSPLPHGRRRDRDRAGAARRLRRRIVVASAALLLLCWNAIAVLGTKGGAGALASPTVGNSNGGSIDITAPVTTRQS
jgi:hypothetical protein